MWENVLGSMLISWNIECGAWLGSIFRLEKDCARMYLWEFSGRWVDIEWLWGSEIDRKRES